MRTVLLKAVLNDEVVVGLRVKGLYLCVNMMTHETGLINDMAQTWRTEPQGDCTEKGAAQ